MIGDKNISLFDVFTNEVNIMFTLKRLCLKKPYENEHNMVYNYFVN